MWGSKPEWRSLSYRGCGACSQKPSNEDGRREAYPLLMSRQNGCLLSFLISLLLFTFI